MISKRGFGGWWRAEVRGRMRADPSTFLPAQMKDGRGRIIKLRAYDEKDYPALIKMYDDFEPKGIEAGIPPMDDRTRRQWIDQMVSSFFNVMVLYRNRVVGHAGLDLSDPHGCPEYLIFILKNFRHCGIGTRLSQIMKEISRTAGCQKIWVSVRTSNAIAVRVFKKVGFVFVGPIDIQREMELNVKNAGKNR